VRKQERQGKLSESGEALRRKRKRVEVKTATALLVLSSPPPVARPAEPVPFLPCELCGATFVGPKLLTDHVAAEHLREVLAVQPGAPSPFQAVVLRTADAVRALLPSKLRGGAAAEAGGQGDQRTARGQLEGSKRTNKSEECEKKRDKRANRGCGRHLGRDTGSFGAATAVN